MNAWYKIKEQSAGYYRIYTLYLIYKIFGAKLLKFILFFVMLFIFPFAGNARAASREYLSAVFGKKASIFQVFKHILSFSHSLVDKIDSFAGNFPINKINYNETYDNSSLKQCLEEKKGMFFLCSHLGNIEILRVLLLDWAEVRLNIFLQVEQTAIFNNFIQNIAPNSKIKIYSVLDIDINTSVEISEKLDNGEIVFMAGDRVSAKNPNQTFTRDFLGKSANFPQGVFRFAQMMECPIYFITCTKNTDGKYIVYTKKHEKQNRKQADLLAMQNEFVDFLESKTREFPYQWYNFFDFWEQKEPTQN